MRYAVVEKSLGEIDRARAIYQHAARLCDPNKDEEFWNVSALLLGYRLGGKIIISAS